LKSFYCENNIEAQPWKAVYITIVDYTELMILAAAFANSTSVMIV